MIPVWVVFVIIFILFIRERIMFKKLPSDNFDAGYEKALDEIVLEWNISTGLEYEQRLIRIRNKLEGMQGVLRKRKSNNSR